MSQMNRLLSKTFIASAEVPARRIVRLNAIAGVLPSNSATREHIGVSDTVGPIAIGGRCDVILLGLAEVEAGGVIAPGAPVTADAIGRAVTAGPAQIAMGYAIGDAEAVGDIVTIVLARHTLET